MKIFNRSQLTIAAALFCGAQFSIAQDKVNTRAQLSPQVLANCAAGIDIEKCISIPVPSDCPSGKKWSLAGTGIAHCVGVDTSCPANKGSAHERE
ncbi:hypothetical protein RCH09_003637 [Actimicrobium sp. GrIS 1.19]|uniref:hypothetical protein n=1 Tax=Actimicrobium sp. GrIS 1.19 TaxID=3071708 RepID=UPI002DFD8C5F|nr:hypothetical protein [Actimicrobium sp. GrIS 1.19]